MGLGNLKSPRHRCTSLPHTPHISTLATTPPGSGSWILCSQTSRGSLGRTRTARLLLRIIATSLFSNLHPWPGESHRPFPTLRTDGVSDLEIKAVFQGEGLEVFLALNPRRVQYHCE